MKTIILSIVFLILLASACTEEVIFYRDRIVYDSIPFIVNTFKGYDLDSTRSFKVVGADTVEVIRVDTVERQARITYEPMFENFVNNFFELVDSRMGRSGMLNVDVDIRTEKESPSRYTMSDIWIEDGRWVINLHCCWDCSEASIYRELLHILFNKSYRPQISAEPLDWPDSNVMPEGLMSFNWPFCLEGMSEDERDKLITEAFGPLPG